MPVDLEASHDLIRDLRRQLYKQNKDLALGFEARMVAKRQLAQQGSMHVKALAEKERELARALARIVALRAGLVAVVGQDIAASAATLALQVLRHDEALENGKDPAAEPPSPSPTKTSEA